MKLREYLILFGGMISMFVFVVFMIKFSNERKEIELLDKTIQADTLLVQKQSELEKQDAYLLNQQKQFGTILKNQNKRLDVIETRIDSLNNNVLKLDSIKNRPIVIDSITIHF